MATSKLSTTQLEYRVGLMNKANLTNFEQEAFRQIMDSYNFLEKENSDLRLPSEQANDQEHINDPDTLCYCKKCCWIDRGGI